MRKRGYRRRTRRYKKKQSNGWGAMAKKALQTANFVKNLINAEYKYVDTTFTPAAVTYNGAVLTALNVIVQGDGASERTGDSVKMKNLTIRGEFSQNGTTQEIVRLIIFVDKQNVITGGNEVLQTVGSSLAVFSPKNTDTRYDTKILYDQDFKITSDNPIVKLEKVFKLNLHENFVTGTNTITNNAIKICVLGQNAATGTLFSHYSRITYMDN